MVDGKPPSPSPILKCFISQGSHSTVPSTTYSFQKCSIPIHSLPNRSYQFLYHRNVWELGNVWWGSVCCWISWCWVWKFFSDFFLLVLLICQLKKRCAGVWTGSKKDFSYARDGNAQCCSFWHLASFVSCAIYQCQIVLFQPSNHPSIPTSSWQIHREGKSHQCRDCYQIMVI